MCASPSASLSEHVLPLTYWLLPSTGHTSHLFGMGMSTVSTVPLAAVPSPGFSANTSLRVPSRAVCTLCRVTPPERLAPEVT